MNKAHAAFDQAPGSQQVRAVFSRDILIQAVCCSGGSRFFLNVDCFRSSIFATSSKAGGAP